MFLSSPNNQENNNIITNFSQNLTLRSSFIYNNRLDCPIRDSILCLPKFINIPIEDTDSLRDNIFDYPATNPIMKKNRKFPQKLKLKEKDELNQANSKDIKKTSKEKEFLSSLSLNRSFNLFEKQQYINKNASFIQINQDNDTEEDMNNRSFFVKPQEIMSKEVLSNLINLYEPKINNMELRRTKKSETINVKNRSIDTHNALNANFFTLTDKKDEIKLNLGKNENEIYSNNFNKLATKSWIDDPFDSPREKEFRNLENFEEDNECSNFNISVQKESMTNNIMNASNNFNNFQQKQKKVYISDDEEDFIYDGRNRHVFSFYNKNNKNNQEKIKQINSKLNNYTIVKSDIETISEHPHENVMNMSYNYNNLSYLDGKNGNGKQNPIENEFTNPNANNLIINNYGFSLDLKIETVNNFVLSEKNILNLKDAKDKTGLKFINDKMKKDENITKIENVNNIELSIQNNKNINDNYISEIPFDIKNLNLNLNLIEKKKNNFNANKINLDNFILKNTSSNNNTNLNNNSNNSNFLTNNINMITKPESDINKKNNNISSALTESLKSSSKEKNILTNNENILLNITSKPNRAAVSYPSSAISSNSFNMHQSNGSNKKINFLDTYNNPNKENKSEYDPNTNINPNYVPEDSNKYSFYSANDNLIKTKLFNSEYKNSIITPNTNSNYHNNDSPKINDLYNFNSNIKDSNGYACFRANTNNRNINSYNISNKHNKHTQLPPQSQSYSNSSISTSKKPSHKINSNGTIGTGRTDSVSKHSNSQIVDEDFSYSNLYKLKSIKKSESIMDNRHKSNYNNKVENTGTKIMNNEQSNLNIKNENLNSKNFHNFNDLQLYDIDKNSVDKNKTQTHFKTQQHIPQCHQFVVLQKHLPYSKYNLDLQPKTKAHDEKEVLYNNVADYQTLNQLINSVKKAYNHQMTQFKKTQNNKLHNTGGNIYRSTSPGKRQDKFRLNDIKYEKNEKNIDKLERYYKIEKNEKYSELHYKSSYPNTNQNSLYSYNSSCANNKKKLNQDMTKTNTNKKQNKNMLNIINTNQNIVNNPNPNLSHISIKKSEKVENNFDGNFPTEAIDENTLVELLEEIKERSNKIQIHFKSKEENMNNHIKELNENIKSFQEKEKNLRDEIEVWKSKLAFFIEDFRKKSNENKTEKSSRANLFTLTTNSNSELKNEEILKNFPSEKTKKNLPPIPLSNININDLPKVVSEKTFSEKYDIPKLKSFALILKEIGLDMSTFYDQISLNELEDDICQECFADLNSNDVNKMKNFIKKNTNSDYSDDSIYSNHICRNNKWNYKKAFDTFPQLKTFIKIFAKKLNYENKTRLKLEEKTLKILSNDFKAIDNLDQKVKKLERRHSSTKVTKDNLTTSSINRSSDYIKRDEFEI